jgi:hypothetical protein
MFPLRSLSRFKRLLSPGAHRSGGRRYRPWLETLENREAPAVFNINNGDVPGLIAAITTANTNNQPDTINLATGGVYNFASGYAPDGLGTALPQINADGSTANTVTVNGNGATLQASAAGFRCLWVTGGVLLANNLTIQNFASPAGSGSGAIVVGRNAGNLTGQATFTNLTINNNIGAVGNGVGYIYGPNSLESFNNCTITNNKVTAGAIGGGAFGNGGNGTVLNFTNCILTGNTSNAVGGVIEERGTNTQTNLTNCTVSGNMAGGNGGVLSITGTGATVSVNSSTLATNSAGGNGGVLSISGSGDTVTITGSTLTQNTATGHAGTMYIKGGINENVTISNSTISGNKGNIYEGGIELYSGTSSLTINNTSFANNACTVQGYGGAIANFGGTLTVANTTFAGNSAARAGGSSGAGGAIWINMVQAGANIFRSDTFTGNTAGNAVYGTGGAIELYNGPLTLVDCILSGDSAFTNGTDLYDRVNVAVVSNTLVGSNKGCAVTVVNGTNGNIVNPAANLGPLQHNGGFSTGAPTSLTPIQTVALLAGSPAIDAGATYVSLAATDERGAGFNRIINGKLDIGAFEFQPPATTTTVTSSLNPSNFGQAVTFTATVTPNASGSNAIQGTVAFLDNGTALATVTLSSGMATFTTSTLVGGNHTITAQFNGFTQGNYTFSASMATVSQTVIPPPTPSPPPTPPPTIIGIFATGADTGSLGVVNVYDARTQQLKFTLLPFGPLFTGGVRVAVGDVNGDGVPDIICGAGPGALPEVIVFDGRTQQPIMAFFAFSGANAQASNISNIAPFFTGGVYVAAGDVNGDGFADIIVGAGEGGGPQVEVFSGKTGTVIANFFAFGTPNFRGGVRVAAGDVNGDGRADIICGAGPGGGPQVEVYDGANLNAIANFFAFAPSFVGGVFVAAGQVNGGKLAQIICGAGAGGGPQVSIFDGSSLSLLGSFFAYNPAFSGGVHVAARDVNGDGRADIITGPGRGGLPELEAFDGQSLAQLVNFFTILSVGGINVG